MSAVWFPSMKNVQASIQRTKLVGGCWRQRGRLLGSSLSVGVKRWSEASAIMERAGFYAAYTSQSLMLTSKGCGGSCEMPPSPGRTETLFEYLSDIVRASAHDDGASVVARRKLHLGDCYTDSSTR
ncbi:hypothetical protein NDU88_000817 [Pleurodeles waltl]|uniref:Uncharacterized protein n=1 Tax=Pleurodeles waltl TaxID=8319 RepID=A0AAV7V626_PLEWA|nr:hypothetical protein NDU88_000817 [Pleurodeles waltl]